MLEFFLEINGLRIMMALGMLLIASVMDLWKREIHDYLWIAFGAIAFILLIFEPDMQSTFLKIGFSMIIAPLAIVAWRIGFFGGADAFCLVVLAGLVPMMTLSDNDVSPFTILTNATVLSIVPLFTNAIRNMIDISNHKDIFYGFEETRLRKICAIFLGYRSANPKYSFSIEKIVGGKKMMSFSLHHAENADFCNTKDTWVTPGIPYILYIAGGFLIQLFFGDLFLNVFGNFIIMR